MSVSWHYADNTLSATEKLRYVVALAYECATEMLLLAGKLFTLVVFRIIGIKEYLSLLKNIKLVKITLVLYNSLTDIGKE